jgi:hypothetical protein
VYPHDFKRVMDEKAAMEAAGGDWEEMDDDAKSYAVAA